MLTALPAPATAQPGGDNNQQEPALPPPQPPAKGLHQTISKIIETSCVTDPDDFGMVQLGQAFARR